MTERLAKGIFVVGTDTGVGKTVVAAGLALALKQRGLKVGVMKPVATGCLAFNNRLYSQDAIYLFEAAENEYPLLSNPIRFRNPLAPSVASQVEKTGIHLKKIMWAYHEIREHYDFLIVEGIGGLLVPFTNNYFLIDMVKEFALPMVIVARVGLGTINHTLLTVEAARARHLEIRGIILNGMPQTNVTIAEQTNPRVIQDLTGIPVLGVIPQMSDVDVEKFLFGNLGKVFQERVALEPILQ